MAGQRHLISLTRPVQSSIHKMNVNKHHSLLAVWRPLKLLIKEIYKSSLHVTATSLSRKHHAKGKLSNCYQTYLLFSLQVDFEGVYFAIISRYCGGPEMGFGSATDIRTENVVTSLEKVIN